MRTTGLPELWQVNLLVAGSLLEVQVAPGALLLLACVVVCFNYL